MWRRDFLKFIRGTILYTLFPSCSEGKDSKFLQNEDREGFYIRFYKPFKPVDEKKWTLTIDGLCERPLRLHIENIKKLPLTTQTSRLKCVECWSSKAKWTGFRPEILFSMVKPLKTAKYVYFFCEDGYFEYISIDDLLKPKVLLVHTMNDRDLPKEHGAPLRLIIPFKYGYKNVKTINRLSFVDHAGIGYWSQFGYSNDGTIQPGKDYQLDTGQTKIIKKLGGETD